MVTKLPLQITERKSKDFDPKMEGKEKGEREERENTGIIRGYLETRHVMSLKHVLTFLSAMFPASACSSPPPNLKITTTCPSHEMSVEYQDNHDSIV